MRVLAALLIGGVLLASRAAAQSDPSQVGEWSGLISLPIVTIHMQVLPDGKLLAWGNSSVPPTDGKGPVRLWDPSAAEPVFQEAQNPFVDIYCSGHTLLADGRLLTIGGHIDSMVGSDATTTFNPFTRRWTNGQRMSAGRWYPSATVLGNGDVLTTSGDVDTTIGVNTLPQVYRTADGTWRDLTSAQLSLPLYPWMHLAPNGKVFNSGPGRITRYLDTGGTGEWTTVAATNFGDRRQYEGASVMYQPGKVLILGGGRPATATAELIDLNEHRPRWRYTRPMSFPRRVPNATLLPDGKVLVTGGTGAVAFSDPSEAVQRAEIWNPETEAWSTMSAMSTSRLYHSTAVLLPDGRVFVSGGGGDGAEGDVDHYDGEYFSPPYLFRGRRPTIDAAPADAAYAEQFTLRASDADGIRAVTLVALSGTTHEHNMNQRFLRLAFAPTAEPNRFSVTVPDNPNMAPPGYYMLFVLNGNGVPSVARMLRLGRGEGRNQAPQVEAGADRAVTLPATASLAGRASDDGRPGRLTTSWSMVSGPGTVAFGDIHAPKTSASFSSPGIYVLRLSASDGALESSDDLTVTVRAAPSSAIGGIFKGIGARLSAVMDQALSLAGEEAAGKGLTGSYFNGAEFDTPAFTRTDPAVDFEWGAAAPAPGVQGAAFSVRWSGQVQAPATGTYTFSTVSSGRVRLYVEGERIIDNWALHATTGDTSRSIALQAGLRYSIVLEYSAVGGSGLSRLLWTPPGEAQAVIPAARLFP